MKKRIYLDDMRTPVESGEWVVVRNYDEFVQSVLKIGIENISFISLDHDLGESAMKEYFNNVVNNYVINYNNIKEKTGYDCAKWLVEHFISLIEANGDCEIPQIYSHSANPVGAANIIGYINNFLKNYGKPQTCVRIYIKHHIGNEV